MGNMSNRIGIRVKNKICKNDMLNKYALDWVTEWVKDVILKRGIRPGKHEAETFSKSNALKRIYEGKN